MRCTLVPMSGVGSPVDPAPTPEHVAFASRLSGDWVHLGGFSGQVFHVHTAPALVQCQFLQGNSQDGPATGGRAGGRGEGRAGWQCERLYRLCCSAPPRLSSRAL